MVKKISLILIARTRVRVNQKVNFFILIHHKNIELKIVSDFDLFKSKSLLEQIAGPNYGHI
jgi:hypothetical protein